MKEELKKAYLTLQAACGIKPGDTVEVLRSAENHEMGWENDWPKEMSSAIGKPQKVTAVSGIGIRLEGDYHYPFFVLRKVADAEPQWTGHNPENIRPSDFPEECIRFLEEFEKHGFWENYPFTGHIAGYEDCNFYGIIKDETLATDLSIEELAAAREEVVLTALEKQGWKAGARAQQKGGSEFTINSVHLWQPGQPIPHASWLVEEKSKDEDPFIWAAYCNEGACSPITGLTLLPSDPEPEYVPFDLSLEADKAKLRGAWVRNTRTREEFSLDSFSVNSRDEWRICGYTTEQLFDYCVFLDGTPCGKVKR